MTILIQGIDDGSTVDNQFQMATFNPVPISKNLFTTKEITNDIDKTATNAHSKKQRKSVINSNKTHLVAVELEKTELLTKNNIAERDSVVIFPTISRKEEKMLVNNTNEKEPVLTVCRFLKKEATKKILQEEPTDNKQPLEIVVADLAAKVAGKKGDIKKNKNNDGEIKAYALNIGKFSISRKVKN